MELMRSLQAMTSLLLTTILLLQGVVGSGKKEDGGWFSRRDLGVPGATDSGQSGDQVEGGFGGGEPAARWGQIARSSAVVAGGLLPDIDLGEETDRQDGSTGKGSETWTAARGASLDGSQGSGGCASYHMIGCVCWHRFERD